MFQRTFDVITIGGATRDIMFFSPAGRVVSDTSQSGKSKLIGFKYGAKILAKEIHFLLGGGGSNSAVAFARLGLRVAAFLRVGQDRDGDAILADLVGERVATKFVERDQRLRTGFSFLAIQEPTMEHIAYLYRGANDAMVMTQAELKRAQAKWLYVASLGEERWPTTSANLIAYLRTHPKVQLAWNPGENQLAKGRRGLAGLMKHTTVFNVNRDEATQLVAADGYPAPGQSVGQMLKIIRSWGPRIVLITCGRKGSYAFDGRKRYFEPIKPFPVKDTTGAGDAFGSTFVAGLQIYRNDIGKALRMATINSGSGVSQIGAQPGLLRRAKLLELAKKYYGKTWQ
ncbi:MAG: carbohydrate kinase family protein [Patescibacteria group bacterium]|jgi:ribokinase